MTKTMTVSIVTYLYLFTICYYGYYIITKYYIYTTLKYENHIDVIFFTTQLRVTMLLMGHTDVNHVFPSGIIKLIIYFTYFSLVLTNLKSASHICLRHYHTENLLNVFPWGVIILKIWLTYFPRAFPNLESASRIHCSTVWRSHHGTLSSP